MTLQVTLWDPHSSYARENVYEDTYAALSNVRVKLDKMNGAMEGVLHTDQMYPEKVSIRALEGDYEIALKNPRDGFESIYCVSEF